MSDDNSGHTVGHYPSERVITPVFTYADGRMGPAPDQIIVPAPVFSSRPQHFVVI